MFRFVYIIAFDIMEFLSIKVVRLLLNSWKWCGDEDLLSFFSHFDSILCFFAPVFCSGIWCLTIFFLSVCEKKVQNWICAPHKTYEVIHNLPATNNSGWVNLMRSILKVGFCILLKRAKSKRILFKWNIHFCQCHQSCASSHIKMHAMCKAHSDKLCKVHFFKFNASTGSWSRFSLQFFAHRRIFHWVIFKRKCLHVCLCVQCMYLIGIVCTGRRVWIEFWRCFLSNSIVWSSLYSF